MRSLIAVLAALVLVATSNDALAQKKPKTKLPSAVESSFKKDYPNAVIKGTDKEKKDGKTYYEIESMDGKTKRDFLYTEDGKIYESEESIDVKSLPDEVQKSVAKDFPKGKIAQAEKVKRGDATEYEVTVKKGTMKHEVRYGEDGNKVKKSSEAEDEDEEKEEK